MLSLFFLDRVDNYRVYNDDGTYNLGKYALLFEELYKNIIQEEKYKELRKDIDDLDQYANAVHHGYFSQDKLVRRRRNRHVKIQKSSESNRLFQMT